MLIRPLNRTAMPPAFLIDSLAPRLRSYLSSLGSPSARCAYQRPRPYGPHRTPRLYTRRRSGAPPHVAPCDWSRRIHRAPSHSTQSTMITQRLHTHFVLIRQVPVRALARPKQSFHLPLSPGWTWFGTCAYLIGHVWFSSRAIWRRELSVSGRRSGRLYTEEGGIGWRRPDFRASSYIWR